MFAVVKDAKGDEFFLEAVRTYNQLRETPFFKGVENIRNSTKALFSGGWSKRKGAQS